MELYPFQDDGVRFLCARHDAYLGDEMGLGKTVQAIAAANVLHLGGTRVLVVCPASVLHNWKREWDRWSTQPQPTIMSYDAMRTMTLPEPPPPAAIHVQNAPRPAWSLVIFDEAHYLKNPNAQRTRVAAKVAAMSERVWMLSGTPTPNNAAELYAPMRMLMEDRLAAVTLHTYMDFLRMFCVWRPTEYGVQITGVKNVARLRELIRPVFLRRRAAEVLRDLPPLRIDHVRLDTGAQADASFGAEMQRILDEAGVTWDPTSIPDSPHISRLRRFVGEYKVAAIAALLTEELTDDPAKKLVVMAHHRLVLDALEDRLHFAGVVRVDGSTLPALRAARVAQFQEQPTTRVFLGQNTAAGIGINLTAASDVVLVEPPWSPEDMMQIIKRVHRIGQDAPCRARVYSVPDTLDEAIMSVLVQKTRMIDATIN